MINKIIEEIETSKMLDILFTNMRIPQEEFDDLKQEIYIIILDYDREKIIEMYEKKQLKYWLVRVITNQYFSKYSTYYYKYRKYYEIIDKNNLNKDNNEDEE